MAHVSIIGTGNMGQAIAGVAGRGGHTVELLGQHDTDNAVTGDIVVLAVPYPAVADVLAERGEQLAGKIVVDITNPLNFETFDSLIVPADSSAAAEIAAALPQSRVLKAFNTTFAATLASGTGRPADHHRADRRRRRRRQVAARRRRHRRRPEGHRRRLAAARPRARGARLPADHPRRRREDLLDRRLRRRRLTRPRPLDPTRSTRTMTVNAVRLNHAVLFVADLERSSPSTSRPSAWRSWRASPARTPPSCGCPGRATTTTSACSGSAPSRPARAAALGLYHLAWQVDTIEELEQARAHAGRPRRLHRRVQPRRDQERLRPRPRRQRVRGHVDAAQASWGEYENAAPVERLDLAAEVQRWAGVRTAAELVPLDAS